MDVKSTKYQSILSQLLETGIEKPQAIKAIEETDCESFDAALEYLYSDTTEDWDDESDQPELGFKASEDDWDEDSDDQDYMDMGDQDVDFSMPDKDVLDEEHIKLVQINKDDIFTHDQLMDHIVANLNEVSQVLGISTSNASSLLKKYKWNKEQLTERYFQNPEKVLSKLASNDQVPPPMLIDECVICGDEGVPMKSLECQHAFCVQCWKDHIEESINTGKSDNICCMQAKCPQLIVDPNWLKPIISTETMTKFITFWVNSFVDLNPVWKRCPNPECEYLIKSDGTKELRCVCGYVSCPLCPLEGHEPATCKKMVEWDNKCKTDGPTFQWMKTNTQDCPACKFPIEKNNGCNAMICGKCKHEFCWICLGDNAAHGVTTHGMCNGDTPKSWLGIGKQATSRVALEKYTHYFHRFHVHEQSQKFEKELRQKALEQRDSLYKSSVSNKVLEVITEAAENLIECRRVLKITYVVAYYMKKENQKRLFEFAQADLEKATEALSKLLERDENPENIILDIRHKSNHAAKMLIKFLDDSLAQDVVEKKVTTTKAPVKNQPARANAARNAPARAAPARNPAVARPTVAQARRVAANPVNRNAARPAARPAVPARRVGLKK